MFYLMIETGSNMSAINNFDDHRHFASACAVDKAIALVTLAVIEKNESEERQQLLDAAHDELDCDFVRDFSGIVTGDPGEVVEIVRNAFVVDAFAVEVTRSNGDTEFIYLPADKALTFLKTVQATMAKQVHAYSEDDVDPGHKEKNGRKYKSIRKVVFSKFNDQVVSIADDYGPRKHRTLALPVDTVRLEIP
jgi:hypothetical protein